MAVIAETMAASQAAQLSLREHCSRHSSGDRGSGRCRRYALALEGLDSVHLWVCWVDGWMDGWTEGRRDGRTDKQIDRYIDR